ncbi:MAG: ABC transporter substrate-binding protein, partial [Cohnella sp.]|nr:ABC transporter substrate-binding protein [Cohnella sp.]
LTSGDKQTLDDPKTVEALNFVSRIATEKVARPTEGGDWTEPGQFFRQGNTLMYTGAMWEIGGLKTDMKDYDIGFVPFPKGPSADSYHSLEGMYQALAIPKAVKDPDKLMYIWEKYNDIDSIYDYPGQAGYEQNLSTEEDINNAKLSAAGLLVLEHFTYPKFPYWELNGDLLNGESVSTVIEKYKAQSQAAIDEVYKQ